MDANEWMLDRQIARAVVLARLSNGEVRWILSRVDASDRVMLGALSKALKASYIGGGSYDSSRLHRELDQILEDQRRDWQGLLPLWNRRALTIAGSESEFQASTLEGALLGLIAVERATEAELEEIVGKPFASKLRAGQWGAKINLTKAKSIRAKVTEGVAEGWKPGRIYRAIKGAKSASFKDGVLHGFRNAYARAARTRVGHIGGWVRDKIARLNPRAISAHQWISVLDSRTSGYCIVRDGQLYDAQTYEPLTPGPSWSLGPGRLHPNCRSVSMMVTVRYDELGLPKNEVENWARGLADAKRGTPSTWLTGDAPPATNYLEWMSRQPPKELRAILGPTRLKLMRGGHLPFDRFVNHEGDFIRLADLETIERQAFKAAGLA